MSSEKQIAANRRNGCKSRGPRDGRWKIYFKPQKAMGRPPLDAVGRPPLDATSD